MFLYQDFQTAMENKGYQLLFSPDFKPLYDFFSCDEVGIDYNSKTLYLTFQEETIVLCELEQEQEFYQLSLEDMELE